IYKSFLLNTKTFSTFAPRMKPMENIALTTNQNFLGKNLPENLVVSNNCVNTHTHTHKGDRSLVRA
ncbi:hypothetical protein RAO14_09060, partial [Ornithobacterium rhinotracheale]